MDGKAAWVISFAVKSMFDFFYMHLCKITFSGQGGGAGDWKGEKREPLSWSLRGFVPCIESSVPQLFLVYLHKLAGWVEDVSWEHLSICSNTQIWLFSTKPLQLMLWFVCFKTINSSFLTVVLWSTIGKKICSF